MSKVRTFDNGKLSITFSSEEAAKSFDEYYESEWTIVYNGEKEKFKIKDNFNPYKFFNVKEECED